MSIESLVTVERQPDNRPKATVPNINCSSHVSFQCYYFKIIKSYFLTVLCADWWKTKGYNKKKKHLMIDLTVNDNPSRYQGQSPVDWSWAESQKHCAQGSSKTLKTGWPVDWDKLCFLLLGRMMMMVVMLSLQGTSELYRTTCVCVFVHACGHVSSSLSFHFAEFRTSKLSSFMCFKILHNPQSRAEL